MMTPRRFSSERRIAASLADQRLQPLLEAPDPVFGLADPAGRLDQRRVELGAIGPDLGDFRFELLVGLRRSPPWRLRAPAGLSRAAPSAPRSLPATGAEPRRFPLAGRCAQAEPVPEPTSAAGDDEGRR